MSIAIDFYILVFLNLQHFTHVLFHLLFIVVEQAVTFVL